MRMRGVSGVSLLSWLGAASSQVTLGNANALQRVDYVHSPQRSPTHRGSSVFSGIVPGLALVAGSSALLWWNEGRTARQEHLLRTARREIVGSFDGNEPEEPTNNGKLVHLHGSIESRGLSDPLFSISRPRALRLQRRTEAFQWVEHERTEETRVSESTVKRTRTYSYSTKWSTSLVDSGRFQDHSSRHRNPIPRVVPGVVSSNAEDATLANGVRVGPELISQLDGFQAVPLR